MIIGWLKQLSSGLKQFFKIFQSTKKSCIFVAQNIFTIIEKKNVQWLSVLSLYKLWKKN